MIYIIKIFQLLSDLMLINLAFFLGYFFRLSIYIIGEGKFIHSDFPIQGYLFYGFLASVGTIFFLIIQGRYSIDKPYKNFSNSFISSIISIAIFTSIYFYSREIAFSRGISIYSGIFIFIFLFLNEIFFNFFMGIKKIKAKIGRKTLIIGANQTAFEVIPILKESYLYNIVGILDAYGTKFKEIEGIKVLGKLNKFEDTVKDFGIQQIVQVDNLEQSINIMNFCENKGIEYFISPTISGVYQENIEAYKVKNGKVFIYLNQTNLKGFNLVFKKVLDLVFSIIILPIFIFLYFLVGIFKFSIFPINKEKRISMGKEFFMYRFKIGNINFSDSYYSDDFRENFGKSYEEILFNKGIKLGFFDKFLLKTKLVEFPQIFNVFRGEMSFIGPRPALEKEFKNYPFYYKQRVKILPGIIGKWQIKNKTGLTFDDMFKTDIEYIRNWSIFLDLKIFFLSIFSFFGKFFSKNKF